MRNFAASLAYLGIICCAALSLLFFPGSLCPATSMENMKTRRSSSGSTALQAGAGFDVKTQQTNRLKSGVTSAAVIEHLHQHIAYIEEQIAEIEQQIKAVIDDDAQLSHDFALLISIKGVGFITAAIFLAEGIGSYRSARALTAHAGLNPKYHSSGSSVNRPPELSKIGSARLRKALYLPALSALRWNPCVKALADRLKAQNRPKMVIVGAAMRKLLTSCFRCP